MNSASSRQLLIAGLWIATAVIPFCLGRMTAPSEPATANNSGASSPKASAPADTAVSPASAWEPSAAALAETSVRLGKPAYEAVTGGQPIDTWLKTLLKQEDDIVRMTGFLKLLETLNSPEDIKKALDIVSAQRGRGGWDRMSRGGEMVMLLQKWAQLDPKGAVAFADASGGRDEKWFATSTVLRTWTRTQPHEALAWAEQHGNTGGEGEGNFALMAVVSQLAKSDLDRAIQAAGTQELSRARGRMMETLVSELISQRGEDAARASVLDLPPGSFRDNMIAQLAGRLADANAATTVEWVMGMPAGDARNRALAETINQWAEDDPTAAGNYLSRLPASAETDSARERYSWQVVRRDPEGALAWAATISDEQSRARTIENLVRTWARRDEAAAKAWVARSQPSDQLKTQAPSQEAARRGP